MKILNLNIEPSGYAQILDQIEKNLLSHTHYSFSYVNAYVALRAMKEKELLNDMMQFSSLFADGIGIFWASRFLYGKNGMAQRINGTDLYYKILNLAEKKGYKIFFFGGGDSAIEYLQDNLVRLFPKIKISGLLGRKFEFDDNIIDILNKSNSDILFLGLGTPSQEKWIASFGKKCNITIQISVGSGIDFLSGVYKRAPLIYQKLGIEWLFRLLLEPKRLWKRYMIGVPMFIFLIIKQKFSNKKLI